MMQHNVWKKNDTQKAFLAYTHQQLLEKYPYLQSLQPKITQTQSSALSYDTAQILLNIATLSYVCYSLYHEYSAYRYELQHPTEPTSFIEQIIRYHIRLLFPQATFTFGTHFTFFIRSFGMIILAIGYKTIAKLILIAAHGDLFDFIGSAVGKTIPSLATRRP